MSTTLPSKYTNESESASNPFEEFVRNRGRSGRAGSLALPNNSLLDLYDKEQEQCNSSVLLLPNNNLRRHSSHNCPIIDDKPAHTSIFKIDLAQTTTSASQTTAVNVNTTILQPPPIPKRTFKGQIAVGGKQSSGVISAVGSVSEPSQYTPDFMMNRAVIGKQNSHIKPFNYRDTIELNPSNQFAGDFCIEHISDDERISLDNSVFEETHPSGYSNRSSSDSNKSQTTADTGYISSTVYEYDKVCTPDSRVNYRSRFSSVDTQSSLDSCQTEKTMDSPLSKESFKLEPGSSSSQNETPPNSAFACKTFRTLPVIPARKQMTTTPKIPPPAATKTTRVIPPAPPLRTQQSIESGKLQNHSSSMRSVCNLGQSTDTLLSDNNNKPLTIRNKFNKANKPPPITYPKLHQRQDSSISNDSLSMTSSPGYNCKSMEAPLLLHASKINKNGLRHQDSNDSFVMTSRYNFQQHQQQINNKMNCRQDSSISSDSFSQTSSPGYNTKIQEAPLLPHTFKICNAKPNFKVPEEIIKEPEQNSSNCPITKSASTPASLQTVVRFQNGSNMSLQHRIINRRKSSNPYVTQGRLKFRLFQILINAVALLAIAGGLAAYFNAYPTVKFINKTIINPPKRLIDDGPSQIGSNPAPGVCLPVIVKFCINHQLPYNYTVFPNYIGHFGQPEAQVELEAFDALVDVQCYELVALFLCSVFVPKCGSSGSTVPPCKILCEETMRRCGFFFDVFGLDLPDYLTCNLFPDTSNPEECVGMKQVRDVRLRGHKPVCSGFLCDQKRCIPPDWRCDGHVDCLDQTDESQCLTCGNGSIYCGGKRCMSQKHVCDGVMDCPWGQDERNCVRLSERNGDLGKGTLEIYRADIKLWAPACVNNWDSAASPTAVCSMLGYSSVNSSRLKLRGSNITMNPSTKNSRGAMMRMTNEKNSNLMKEFSKCSTDGKYPVAELTCTNFQCGKIRIRSNRSKPKFRVVGGNEAAPGDWPFLAAILGGPEQIFYCAGVLIADQWVLTASHCIGNHTRRKLNDWTIQLGVTRRHSHTYYDQKVKVRNVIPHPQYNSYVAHDNDIALFQLATRVAFHEHLLPVCLPPADLKEIKEGTRCTVIGWGKREDKNLNPNAANASYEPTVNEVEVPVLDRDLCNDWLETLNVTDGMICAGYKEGGKDACQGDSGGPLLCKHEDRWYVGGIVSWGIMCAHPKLPGVYANVPKYIPWIKQQINRFSKSNFDSTVGY